MCVCVFVSLQWYVALLLLLLFNDNNDKEQQTKTIGFLYFFLDCGRV